MCCVWSNIQGPGRDFGYCIHKKDQKHILYKGNCVWVAGFAFQEEMGNMSKSTIEMRKGIECLRDSDGN